MRRQTICWDVPSKPVSERTRPQGVYTTGRFLLEVSMRKSFAAQWMATLLAASLVTLPAVAAPQTQQTPSPAAQSPSAQTPAPQTAPAPTPPTQAPVTQTPAAPAQTPA